MKKSNLLLLSLILLCSCSSYDENELITRSVASIDKIDSATDRVTYTGKPEGNVLHFTEFTVSEEKKNTVPSLDLEDSGYVFGSSYALSAPMRLSKDSYYPKEGTDDSGYSYATLSFLLNYSGDHIHHMEFEDTNDRLIFSVKNISKEISIGKVNTDPENPPTKSVKLYARYNLTLTYDKQGFLIEELIETTNIHTDDESKTVHYHVSYEYQTE